MKRIGDILTRNKTPVVVEDGTSYKQVTIRTNYKGVVLRGTQNGSTILTKNQFVVSAGQFILSRIDARNGAFGIIPEELEGAIITNDFLAFDINEDEVEREFFNVFLQSPVFLEACIKASRGNTNRKRVDEDFFLNYQVNLPPLSDQHDLIKQINKGRTKLALAQHEITHQQSLLAKLKQAILQEAIQGKLTADWRAAHPDVEPASQLLQRIQGEKARLIAAKKLRPEKPQPKITPAEIPFEIPKGWEWCRATHPAYLIPDRDKKVPTSQILSAGKFPVVDQGKVLIRGFTDNAECLIELDGPIVLFGDHTREAKYIDFDFVVGADGVKLLRPILVSPKYYHLAISTVRIEAKNYARHFKFLKESFIPLPPLAEQAAIVERVEALMTTYRLLEAEIEHARTRAAHLLQAVLKEAFAPAAKVTA